MTADYADDTDEELKSCRIQVCWHRSLRWKFSECRLPIMANTPVHRELSESIIGAAMAVLNALKPGLDEKLYERALAIELGKRGHRVEQRKEFPVFYDGQHIGTLIPDLIVDELVIVDCKVVTAFSDTHMAQMLGYLNITGMYLAVLLNFKNARLEWKRVVCEGRAPREQSRSISSA